MCFYYNNGVHDSSNHARKDRPNGCKTASMKHFKRLKIENISKITDHKTF